MNRIRRRITYANVVATLALFVALGTGGAWAARTLIPGSTIRPGTIASAQLASNAVTSAKVRNGSLLAADFKAGQLPAGAKGEQGAKGDKGDKGDTGARGAGSVLNSTRVEDLAVSTSFVDVVQAGTTPALAPYSGNYSSNYVTQGTYDGIVVSVNVHFDPLLPVPLECTLDRYRDGVLTSGLVTESVLNGSSDLYLTYPTYDFGVGHAHAYHVRCRTTIAGTANVDRASIGVVGSAMVS